MERQHRYVEYLSLLTKTFPTIGSVYTELINLKAIMELPKGTEHFMSDLHGEYEAFNHIMNNCSGVIREKIDAIFGETLSEDRRKELATMVYYPEQKLALRKAEKGVTTHWYNEMIGHLGLLCQNVSQKYTRSKVRKALPTDFAYILDELIHGDRNANKRKAEYYDSIVRTIIDLGQGDAFILAITKVIKQLAVDHLHILGDIYDRGNGAEQIMDSLMAHHTVDIQWGNHDVLWMGAASGSYGSIATVLNVSLQYGNVDTLENGYGISLRTLGNFAEATYTTAEAFMPKVVGDMTFHDREIIAKMRKAIAIIQMKCEGQAILRHPEYGMDQRLMLQRIDYEAKTITIDGVVHPLKDSELPTIDPKNPYAFTPEEEHVMHRLCQSFQKSPELKKHVHFLYDHGAFYKVYNKNLLFHGCMPLDEEGQFATVTFGGESYKGKALFDYCDEQIRKAYFLDHDHPQKQDALDFIWYLWCGKYSPLLGKHRMTTFERLFVADKSTWHEPKNSYYDYLEEVEMVDRLLEAFGISPEEGHVINGHMPVRLKDGESPVKAGGKLLVIDGGFCKAYQPTTGIAGYTLVYNSVEMRLIAHEPFESVEQAVRENKDIHSTSNIVEERTTPLRVADTDIGTMLQHQIGVLEGLLSYYQERERG